MREIICKAKRKDIDKVTDKWIEGYYVCFNGERHRIYTGHADINYTLYPEYYEIDINTICQLTHMTDINGDKVWENDIVETSNGFLLQVVWSDEYQEFLFKNLKGGYDFMIGKVSELSSFTRDKKFKIVANVFD